nr:retrovirus-related Pol polyprotein from transposon TNT 1-94 [Tanacetum cinerariifolium]
MNQFCEDKGIKREFNVARTPQQNKVAKRRNRTLIEAARTMLVDSKLPTTFWIEAVNTACYVLNRVLVTKPHNKTPSELIRGIPPLIDFMKPFGCPVTILNTRDNLGKFEEKADEGYFVRYSMVSKAMRVFNKRTRIVEETINIRLQENAPNVKRNRPDWLFDIDYLIISMNYVPVVDGNQTNGNAKSKKKLVARQDDMKKELEQEYILIPIYTTDPLLSQGSKDSAVDAGKKAPKVGKSKPSDNGRKNDQVSRKDDDHIPTPSSDPLPSGEDSSILNELMVFYTSLQVHVLDLQETKAAQAKEIVALKKKVFKLNKWRKSRFGGLRRLKKIGSGKRVKSPMEKDSLGAQEDASK